MNTFSLRVKKLTIEDVQGEVDTTAAALYPEDGPSGLFPMKVGSDGNCCPRALSVLVYGKEDYHVELRCRLVIEMASDEEKYLTPSNWDLDQESLNTLASISDDFCNDLSPAGIKSTFRQETLSCIQTGKFMGLWQLFAAAEVLNCPIDIVYPVRGWDVLRRMHHRKIQPLGICNSPQLYLMWSPDRQDQTSEHWTANHILPLLPTSGENADLNTAFIQHEEDFGPQTTESPVNSDLNTAFIHHEESEDFGPQTTESPVNSDLNTAFIHHEESEDFGPPVMSEFYRITWRDGKRYICQVLDVAEEDNVVLLNFMEQRGDLYFWPRPRDISWEPFSAIQQKVYSLLLNEHKSSQRVQYFNVHF